MEGPFFSQHGQFSSALLGGLGLGHEGAAGKKCGRCGWKAPSSASMASSLAHCWEDWDLGTRELRGGITGDKDGGCLLAPPPSPSR